MNIDCSAGNQSRNVVSSYVGMFLLEDTISAVKLSAQFSDFKAFRKELEKTIHFNSERVRKIRACNILKWFFPNNSLDTISSQVWSSYRDEELLQEILRYQFLISQPVAAKFITRCILPLVPGTKISNTLFKQFLAKEFEDIKPYLINNLRIDSKALGFIADNKSNLNIVAEIQTPKTAFLILTHYLFSKSSTIKIFDILQNSYWQYLGISEKKTVRNILHEADAEGLITKYIIADQLEQITTRFSFDEFIHSALRLQ